MPARRPAPPPHKRAAGTVPPVLADNVAKMIMKLGDEEGLLTVLQASRIQKA